MYQPRMPRTDHRPAPCIPRCTRKPSGCRSPPPTMRTEGNPRNSKHPRIPSTLSRCPMGSSCTPPTRSRSCTCPHRTPRT
eukprot:3938612-Rhodomonas_salina.1